MGALTSNRKRGDEYSSLNHGHPSLNSPNFQIAKRPRFSSMQSSQDNAAPVLSSKSAIARVSRYPEAKPPLPRVHAPCRTLKFGSLSSRGNEYGNTLFDRLYEKCYRIKNFALETFRYLPKEKEVVELDRDVEEDSSIEEIELIEDDDDDDDVKIVEPNVIIVEELETKAPGSGFQTTPSKVSNFSDTPSKVEDAGLALDSLSLHSDSDYVPLYKKLLEEYEQTSKLSRLSLDIELAEKSRSRYQAQRSTRKTQAVEKVPNEPFIPLTKEEEAEIARAFSSSNRRKVLVVHENSNLQITGQILLCLRPGAWLNDEVINLYMELLKEREKRDPKKYLKCHFFNTFFYKKLISGNGYDYKSVRRWTTQRKLGYSIADCDKIFVPVHKEIHWCLAVINKKEEKFQYLDSLKGKDTRVMKVLAKYYVDEVKDKSGKDINVSSWKQEFVEDLPEQQNGYDCGMFMIKYADFYSRGLGLRFNQEHMPYFRLRTVKEILRLRAE
ncbi:ubiquitin-like-specific protease ESD4 [Cannabis sativa]|uniref:ubiquitin-like-specific protease ESD4 n=1 Tax=Cannabis sativa TaxID=3483 RepID=UPI0029CA5E9C|nr:ubiquitin-like-specific protease ESD4 [Cannabis sativa]